MIKTFMTSCVNPNTLEIIEQIGIVSMYISDYRLHETFSASSQNPGVIIDALGRLATDGSKLGNAVAINTSIPTMQVYYEQIKLIFPNMQNVWDKITVLPPFKILLMSDSGYYAVSSNTFSSVPAFAYLVSNWNIYTDTNTSLGTIGGAAYGMPFSQSYATGSAICTSQREDIYSGKYIITDPSAEIRVSVQDVANPTWTINYTLRPENSIPNTVAQWFSGVTGDDPSKDPFEEGGHSQGGIGGGGTFTDESEEVDFPDLPTFSAADSGLITLFNPSASQLRSLASYMWGSLFDVSTFQKLFADPMDCILGLSIVPVAVPSGSSREVKVGNIGTGVSMTTASSQYVELDCGSIDVEEYWEAYLDYSPYTKAEIYLPYIGSRALNVDEIMGKTVHVKYHIDILSGACVAYVKCGDAILYQFAGACATSVPVSGKDWTNAINGILSIAGAIGTTVATGGAAAPLAAGVAATSFNTMLKPNIERSGAVSGAAGLLGVQKPYLVLTRPRQCLPEQQNRFMGYPSFVGGYLGSMRGFTIVENVHLDNVPATQEEIDEIENLLKTGVIL